MGAVVPVYSRSVSNFWGRAIATSTEIGRFCDLSEPGWVWALTFSSPIPWQPVENIPKRAKSPNCDRTEPTIFLFIGMTRKGK